MTRRLTGFTLELDGPTDEVQRLLDAFWREYDQIRRDLERFDTTMETIDLRTAVRRPAVRGTISIRESL